MAAPKQDDEKTRPGGERLDESLGFVPLDQVGDEPTSVRAPPVRGMAGRPPTGEHGRPTSDFLRRPTERGVLPLARKPGEPMPAASQPTTPLPTPPTARLEPPPVPRPTPAPPAAEPAAPATPTAPPVRSTTGPRVLVDSGLFREAAAPRSQVEPTDPDLAAATGARPEPGTSPERAAVTALSPRRVLPAEDGQVHVRSPLMRRRTVQGPASRVAQRQSTDIKPLPLPPISRPEARPVIRSGREAKPLGKPSSVIVQAPSLPPRSIVGPPPNVPKPALPPPLPSARSLLKPAQREPTDTTSADAFAARIPTETGRPAQGPSETTAVSMPATPAPVPPAPAASTLAPAHGPPARAGGQPSASLRTRVPTDPRAHALRSPSSSRRGARPRSAAT
ncbi:MAG: hypothetical protein U1F43_38505 [Myxococcota bacterium]